MAADPPPLAPEPPPQPSSSAPDTTVHPPPSHAEIFELIATGSAPPPTSDPRVSLRPARDLPPIEHSDPSCFTEEEEPHTLSEFRESEGSVKRLSILRSLFDSIPIPTNSPPSSPVPSTSALPSTSSSSSASSWLTTSAEKDDDGRGGVTSAAEREQDKKIYARELWRKCNGSPLPSGPGMDLRSSSSTPIASTSTSASISSSPSTTTTATSSSSSATTTKSKSNAPSTVASAAVRWTAFEQYALEKEKELWKLFVELDSDGDMRLRPAEMREACSRAGLDVKEGTLDDFMRTVDKDGDGAISFAEWRNFLLLLPRPTSMPEIFKYYHTHRQHRPSMSRLTQDGDVVIGGGKTGWNRLMNKSAAAAATSSKSSKKSTTPAAVLHDSTNLRQREGENDEKRWARECVECSARSQMAEAADSASLLKKGKEKLVNIVETVTPVKVQKVISPVTTTQLPSSTSTSASTTSADTPSLQRTSDSTAVDAPAVLRDEVEDDEEEEVSDLQQGMFAGAGKFLLAGGLAGAVSRTATAPFDRLKVYLITSPSTFNPAPPRYVPSLGSPEAAAPARPEKKVRRGKGSIPAAVRAIWRQGGGVGAFWTGNGLNVIKIFPESAIKFLSYESAKRVFAQYWDCVPDQTMISNSSRFVAGGIGGVVSQFVIYPIETLKTRVMSSTGGEHKGNALIIRTAQNIWRKGGVKLFFRGLPAGLIGVFPYSAIDMSTFEGIKLAYTKWAGAEPGIPGSLVFGALSGGVGATSVYPLNLVRTRLQAQGTPAHPQTYTGVKDAATKCYRREGWRGFYKGLTPTLVKVVPAVAISYAVYDASKKVLFGREEHCHTVHHDDDSNEE